MHAKYHSVRLGFHVNAFSSHTSSPLQDSVRDKGIFKLQTITVNGQRLNAFFDDGCSDFIITTEAVNLLGAAAKIVSQEEVNKKNVESRKRLPKLPSTVGGETHLMFGIKYLRYFPKLVHQLETGLSLFESPFTNAEEVEVSSRTSQQIKHSSSI